jgi:hypothetical protein
MCLYGISGLHAVEPSMQGASAVGEEPEVPGSNDDEPELPTDEPMETPRPAVRVPRTKRAAMRMRLQAPKRIRLTDSGSTQGGRKKLGGRNLMDACK